MKDMKTAIVKTWVKRQMKMEKIEKSQEVKETERRRKQSERLHSSNSRIRTRSCIYMICSGEPLNFVFLWIHDCNLFHICVDSELLPLIGQYPQMSVRLVVSPLMFIFPMSPILDPS